VTRSSTTPWRPSAPPRSRWLCAVAALTGALSFAFGSDALAQAPLTLPGAVQPGRDRPDIMAPPQPNFDFSIEGPRRSPVPRAVDEIKFQLNGIEINGAMTIPAERFRPLYEDLLGKEVSLSQILDIADAIEAEYRRAGYLLVRAFVPPQRVAN